MALADPSKVAAPHRQRPGHVQAPTPHQADPAIPEPMTQTTITSQVIESTRVLFIHTGMGVGCRTDPLITAVLILRPDPYRDFRKGESPARQLEVIPLSLALTLSHQYARRRYCTGPKAITSKQFDEMLNIMPPQLWRGRLGTESFMLGEMITGDIGAFFVRIHNDYFRINEERTTSHEKLVSMCHQHMKENDYQK